jgi:soluble lytic murein transglycosylase-like protein
MFPKLIFLTTLASFLCAEDISDMLLGDTKAIITSSKSEAENHDPAPIKKEESVIEKAYANDTTQNKSTKNYFVEAGNYYNVAPWLLWAVGKVESGHNPYAVNKNKNGTYDIGIMQINSIHLSRLSKYGITKQKLFDSRTNIYAGAMILRECIDKYGNNWNAVNCYNGMSKENRVYFTYAKKVHNALINGYKIAQR